MGGNNAFLKKQKERDRKFFEAGMQVGMQLASDYITLALRSPDNRQTLEQLLQKRIAGDVFGDVNIRPPLYSEESILLSQPTLKSSACGPK